MYRSSRLLIAERLRHSPFAVRGVRVVRKPMHEPQQCLKNANMASKIDVLRSGSEANPVVAGWLVHKHDPIDNKSEIVQHWWNFDPIANIYFDTTPLEKEIEEWGFEYLLDEELLHVATTRLQDLEHTVGRDLVLSDGKWYLIDSISDDGDASLRHLDALSVDKLMHFKNPP